MIFENLPSATLLLGKICFQTNQKKYKEDFYFYEKKKMKRENIIQHLFCSEPQWGQLAPRAAMRAAPSGSCPVWFLSPLVPSLGNYTQHLSTQP